MAPARHSPKRSPNTCSRHQSHWVKYMSSSGQGQGPCQSDHQLLKLAMGTCLGTPGWGVLGMSRSSPQDTPETSLGWECLKWEEVAEERGASLKGCCPSDAAKKFVAWWMDGDYSCFNVNSLCWSHEGATDLKHAKKQQQLSNNFMIIFNSQCKKQLEIEDDSGLILLISNSVLVFLDSFFNPAFFWLAVPHKQRV